jgi:hypothetical protein
MKLHWCSLQAGVSAYCAQQHCPLLRGEAGARAAQCVLANIGKSCGLCKALLTIASGALAVCRC